MSQPWRSWVKFSNSIAWHSLVQRDTIFLYWILFSTMSKFSLFFAIHNFLETHCIEDSLAWSYCLLHSIQDMDIDLSFIDPNMTSSIVLPTLNTTVCSPCKWKLSLSTGGVRCWISNPKTRHEASLAYTYIRYSIPEYYQHPHHIHFLSVFWTNSL